MELFNEIIRIVKYNKPKFIFLENVKHIKKIDNGNVFKTDISGIILDSEDFKVDVSGTIRKKDDNNIFDINSVKMLYAMPENSFALVNKEQNIFLVKITGSNKNSFNKTDEKYIKFVNNHLINNNIKNNYGQVN